MEKFVKQDFLGITVDQSQQDDFERDSDRSEVDRLLNDYVDSRS